MPMRPFPPDWKQSLAVILGEGRAGVRTSSKNLRSRSNGASVTGRDTSRTRGERAGQPGSPGRTVFTWVKPRRSRRHRLPGPATSFRADGPGALAVSVALAPQQSVIALLLQAASGQSHGAPAGLLAAIRNALRPQARFAAQLFTARGHTTIPESALPISPLADASVADQAARLRDLPTAALTDELEAAYGGGDDCPPHWRGAADQPRRWLHSMADASLDTWAVAEPRWRAAGPCWTAKSGGSARRRCAAGWRRC